MIVWVPRVAQLTTPIQHTSLGYLKVNAIIFRDVHNGTYVGSAEVMKYLQQWKRSEPLAPFLRDCGIRLADMGQRHDPAVSDEAEPSWGHDDRLGATRHIHER